ncbi:MAG: hypothetical protein WBB82_03365 [Limnothrix sp.]
MSLITIAFSHGVAIAYLHDQSTDEPHLQTFISKKNTTFTSLSVVQNDQWAIA